MRTAVVSCPPMLHSPLQTFFEGDPSDGAYVLSLDRHHGIRELADDLLRSVRRESLTSLVARLSCSQQRSSTLVAVCRIAVQRFGVILAANDCATIFPFRTTNVSVAAWYELSAVSALHKM